MAFFASAVLLGAYSAAHGWDLPRATLAAVGKVAALTDLFENESSPDTGETAPQAVPALGRALVRDVLPLYKELGPERAPRIGWRERVRRAAEWAVGWVPGGRTSAVAGTLPYLSRHLRDRRSAPAGANAELAERGRLSAPPGSAASPTSSGGRSASRPSSPSPEDPSAPPLRVVPAGPQPSGDQTGGVQPDIRPPDGDEPAGGASEGNRQTSGSSGPLTVDPEGNGRGAAPNGGRPGQSGSDRARVPGTAPDVDRGLFDGPDRVPDPAQPGPAPTPAPPPGGGDGPDAGPPPAEPPRDGTDGFRPLVLIYHTHTSEMYRTDSFAPPNPDDYHRWNTTDTGVVKVGARLVEALRDDHGIAAIQSTAIHDYPVHAFAYAQSEKTVKALLERYPTIRVVIDLHRDGVESPLTVTLGGEDTAQVAVVLATATSSRLTHPEWKQNEQFAQQLGEYIQDLYPGVGRRLIRVDTARYNQQLHPHSILVEVGSYTTDLQAALRTADRLADVLAALIPQLPPTNESPVASPAVGGAPE